MIQNIDIRGINYEVDDSLIRYARRKFGRLDRFLPRRNRDNIKAEIILKGPAKHKGANQYECDTTLKLDGETLRASESTPNVYSAIDVVETKLATGIKKRREQKLAAKKRRRFRRAP